MSLHRYFKPASMLPTPNQAQLAPNVLREVNQVVTEALQREEEGSKKTGTKRKYTKSFMPEDRATIGKYAVENGNAATVKKFKATHDIGESTVRFFKRRYLEEIKKNKNPDTTDVRSVPVLKRGRKVMLGEELDEKVKTYVQVLRSNGAPIGSSVVMAVGLGMIRAHDRTLLVEHGGHIAITKAWAMSLLQRMGYVKRKATTKSAPGITPEVFESLKDGFLKQVARMVQLRNIPDCLIINLDQTGVKLIPVGDWTMAPEGSNRVEVIGLNDKRQITATFAACLDGTFLPMQVLYQGKTDRSHSKYQFPVGFNIFHSPNHWANEETCIHFFENIIFPYIKKVREEMYAPSQKAIVLMDNFTGQTTTALLERLEENGIVVIMVPAGTTDRLQPLDVSTNKAAKDFLREKFRQWYAQEVEKQLQAGTCEIAVKVNMGMAVMKEVTAKWLTALYDKLRLESSIVLNGFQKVGITDAVKKAREADRADVGTSTLAQDDEDPFNSCSEDEDC